MQMTVKELIAVLRKMPQSAIVVVDGYESGFDDPSVLKEFALLNGNADKYDYEGRHRRAMETDSDAVPVVVISRQKP